MNTLFSDNPKSFQSGRTVICTGARIGAPKNIIGKVFTLGISSGGDVGILIDDNIDHIYLGADAKWRCTGYEADDKQLMATLTQTSDGTIKSKSLSYNLKDTKD